MSKTLEVGGTGNYENFSDLINLYKSLSKQLPTGISFKKQGKYLYLQFIHPGTSQRLPGKFDYGFTYEGLVKAKEAAFKIRHALDTITTTTDFWEWYDREILGKNEIVNNCITYREIFETIEAKYWNGRNKNTKRKRSKDIPNDIKGFNVQYGCVFKRFTDWDTQPVWEDIKSVLFSREQGTKTFKDAYSVVKQIISYCPNSDRLLALLSEIDYKQTEFKDKQSISLDEFLKWHKNTLNDSNNRYEANRKSWLWVCSMCVVYGLRPSEIAAALNLDKPYYKDGITIPAINDPNNKELLLVLGDKTYFGTTIKTGARVCKPMTTDKKLLSNLDIQKPQLPEYKPNQNSPETLCTGFTGSLRKNLINWKCPVTQAYAFRHLSNQLGELNGIPQEIRARSLGHSVTVNEQTYKKRSNFQTSIDLLTKHSKDPLSLTMATQQLDAIGFDLNDPSVKAILKVIYQLD